MKNNLFRFVIFSLTLFCAPALSAQKLAKVEISEDDFILLDIVLNNTTIASSIDAYVVDGKLMLAADPLFDALKVRYVIDNEKLIIWQDEKANEFELDENANSVSVGQSESLSEYRWGSDDFYLFIDFSLFQKLYPAKMEYSARQLRLRIITPEKSTLFPLQKISLQEQQRLLDKTVQRRSQQQQPIIPITIADQYRLFTLPHGRVNVAAEKSSSDSGLNSSLQLTSDFLYHSASLTLSDTNENDLGARFTMSRYKTAPDDHILGLYDNYQVGDISSVTNSVSTSTSSGIGLMFGRRPIGFRQSNQAITIQEVAPPGWEAELFHNNIFLGATTVPSNGLLTFEDIDVTYGNNIYQIKLYGPYGEEEVISKNIDLTRNALSKGEFAHSLYGLDNNHRLINDDNDADYGITDYGATFDYGVSDNWQVGFGYAAVEDNQYFYNLKNALTLPGVLLENDVALDNDGNYAQITSVKGGLFERDRFALELETADNFQSNKIRASGKSQRYKAAYFKPYSYFNFDVNAEYQKDDNSKELRVSNRLSGSINQLRLSHSLTYYESTLFNLADTTNTGIIGSLGLSGNLPYDFRVSGKIDYDPEASDPILKSSSIIVQKRLQDYWQGYHYFTLNYQPLADENGSSWRVSHRAAWQADEFQLNISTTYDERDNWSVQLGLQFFIGYDYRNNRFLFNQQLPSTTASLDVHTYLDRQLNGVPDPLDYELSGVTFSGNRQWQNISSGESGRTILPGVYPDIPFRFGAHWKTGSNTINNDYVVYTHPGAYVDVNMPFVLSTDLAGFVLRQGNSQEVGLQNIAVQLFDSDGQLINEVESDRDGYYEFLRLVPGRYQVRVATAALQNKGYTGDIIGYKISTGGNGGYAELPEFVLRRTNESGGKAAEEIANYVLSADNSEPVIWDEDIAERRNYFTLPTKNKVKAKHSLTQESTIQNNDEQAERKTDDEQNRQRENRLSVPEQYPYLNQPVINQGKLPTLSVTGIQQQDTAIESRAQADISNLATTSTSFVIQIGAYQDRKYAEQIIQRLLSAGKLKSSDFKIAENQSDSLYRLVYGSFVSRESGLNFAEKNIPAEQPYFVRKEAVEEKNNIANEVEQRLRVGWVIQLYASRTELEQSEFTKQEQLLGLLYSARKKSAQGTTLYCLVSRIFSTRDEANRILLESGLDGWVSSSDNYQNIQQLN
ncbi:SPOR domain-containing protein [Neptunicella sp. SCSIO 80796]|uniref:SPOR domain-containing protein n=1 Tax=Neptunicella plasticusilytica TaxID=3117012 RepID=UPI003A4D2A63